MKNATGGSLAGGGAGKSKLRPKGYDGFIFNPADLAEDVELDEEIRKELLFLDAHLDTLHHYDLLGVRPKTPTRDIRARYLELSRRFHPDRYYGKRLGSYAARLTRVFQAITAAHETLCDPARKAEHDRVTEVPLTVEEQAEKEREERARARDEEHARKRRQRLVRTNPFLRKQSKRVELLREAEAAEAGENWRRAAELLRLAASYGPEDVSLKARLEDVDRKAKAQRAEELVEKAESAMLVGSHDEAHTLLEEAAAAAPGDLRILVARARSLFSRGAATEDLVAATRQAVKAGRGSSLAWTLHGNALVRAGEKKEAREALRRALKIDPNNAEAKEALKKLKWTLF